MPPTTSPYPRALGIFGPIRGRHPEYTDDEVLIDGEDAAAYAEFGENPDVETHLDEGHHDL